MPSKEKEIILLANSLGVLGLLSINIYLPGLPFLIKYFHTTPQNLKLSISLFLLGFAASQFIWGSLSERFGRKKPILIALFLACVGTVITMLAPNIITFNAGRFIEGTGIGCASVLTRALLTDTFDKIRLSAAISYLTTAANIMPAIAPIIGGYLLLWLGWRFIFLFLLIYSGIILFGFYKKLVETNKSLREHLSLTEAIQDYWTIIRHREFMGYILPYLFLSGGMFGYYAAAPFIFISFLHISAQHYGFIQILTVVSYIVSTNLSVQLMRWFNMDKIILWGTFLGIIAGICLVVFYQFLDLSIFTVMLPMMIFCFAAGLVASNANAGALSTLSQKAGSCGAIISALLYGLSALFSAIIANQDLSSLKPLTIYICVIALFACIGFLKLIYVR